MYANIIRFKDHVGDRIEDFAARLTARTTRRSRLAGATAIVLVMHGVVLWSLIISRPEIWELDRELDETPPLLVELWETQQPPEPKVEPVIVPREVVPQPREIPQAQPKEDLPDAPPQKAVDVPQPAPPQPVPEPEKPTLSIEIPKGTPLEVTAPATVADAPARPSMAARVKRKTKEELAAQQREAASQLSDLNLHETPDINLPSLQSVEPSGLSAAPPAGGRLGAMTPPAGLPSGTGTLKGGRGQASQALQNHDYCVTAQKAGKPIPRDCNMTDLAGQVPLGPRPDAQFQGEVRKKEAYARYKSTPGNSDYWQRVNRAPTPNDRRMNDESKPGAYSDAKDQRAKGNGGGTADPKAQEQD